MDSKGALRIVLGIIVKDCSRYNDVFGYIKDVFSGSLTVLLWKFENNCIT